MQYSGVVIKSTGSWYLVAKEKEIINCKIKGNFRTKGFVATNPLTVGDHVDFIIKKEENTGLITKLHPRKNYIIRKSINLSKKAQIIAANVDMALLMATIKMPETHTKFIDRFLVSAQAYKIPVSIIFNKIDLYNSDEMEQMNQLFNLYNKIGYACFSISVTEKKGLQQIISLLKNKISVVSGNSGVGKSSLINALDSNLQLKTASISDYHRKGKHTTTFSEMLKFSFGGYIIDTPGIKGYGLIDFENENLAIYFPEMLALQNQCKYYNCTHTHEPQCAVIKAVKNNEIALSRYESYLSMLDDENNKYRTDIYG